ncbi:protein TolR [Leucothrix pacifica]|uniref:Protein TolR n=1 Tax=Leucothrix pacifica TaxID=1247513 RepID=A0A317CPE4_9GAMM|nr:protein TolR [Leucothrix pacifica]PWR00098.1 protein TolR [Leucothrix pacifica]
MARRSRGGRRSMADMNVVPYIDVMLVLLVIFMVTAPMMQTGIELNLPNADTTPIVNNSGSTAVVISVDETGQYFVDGSDALDLDELGDLISRELSRSKEKPVYIRADKEVSYGFLMQAMAAAQQAGATNIGLMADPDALKN